MTAGSAPAPDSPGPESSTGEWLWKACAQGLTPPLERKARKILAMHFRFSKTLRNELRTLIAKIEGGNEMSTTEQAPGAAAPKAESDKPATGQIPELTETEDTVTMSLARNMLVMEAAHEIERLAELLRNEFGPQDDAGHLIVRGLTARIQDLASACMKGLSDPKVSTEKLAREIRAH